MTGNEVEIRVVGKDATGNLFDRMQAKFAQWLTKLRQLFAKAGDDSGHMLVDGLWRSADGRLRDVYGRFAKAGEESGRRFSSGFLGVLSGITMAMGDILHKLFTSGIGGALNSASSGPYGWIAGALLAMAAAAAVAAAALLALAPVVYLVGAAFGAATTAGFGLVAMVGVLMLGLGGLGEAWKAYGQKSGGGGAAGAAAAREVKAATDALADAQRAAQRASEDVNRARAEETERLEDLSRALAGARLDEEGASLAILRARRRLSEARRSGSGLDVAEAELGYRQAVQSLEMVKDRVQDLQQEQDKANEKGVEGSDRVQAALENQARAQRDLADAATRLSEAGRGGAGGVDKFAEAMGNLSANGQKLIQTFIGLKPAFDDLKRSVQDRLLAGLDVTFKDLATKWLPELKPMLGGLADSINRMFKGLTAAVSTPKFIADMKVAVGGFGAGMERLGEGIGKLIGGLGRLGAAATPVFLTLMDLVAGTFENFAKWIEKADESGSLQSFMEKASKALRELWTISGLIIDVFGELVKALMPNSEREGKGFLENTKLFLEGLRDWLADPENKQKIRDWIGEIQDFGDKISDTMNKIDGWVNKIDGWIARFEDLFAVITGANALAKVPTVFDGLKDSFRNALNWIIDRWNALEFKMPGFSIFGQQVGGGSITTKDIPRFAHGGIGGGLARVAERGRELIDTPGGMLLAMPHGSTVMPNGATEAMLGRGGGTVRVQVDLTGADEDLRRRIQKITKVFGDGNVQVAFGQARSSS